MPTDRLYTGQQRFGAKSGIYNYVSRFYSADMGRFPQPDSMLPNVFEPQALSRYTYVQNNPANYTDPTGHFGFGVIPGFDVGGGGGGSPCPSLPPPASVAWIEPIKEDRLQTLNYCVSLGHFVRDPVNGTGGHSIVLWGGSVQCFPPGAVTRITCQAKINRYISPFSVTCSPKTVPL
jgi:RHS repeat-associated protein